MARTIGIRHQRKWTQEGEARPTLVAIKENSEVRELELPDDMAELDFVLGRFPLGFRKLQKGERVSQFPKHHVQYRKVRGSEAKAAYVPRAYDGLRDNDTIFMVLGGSGDRFAYALSRRAEELQDVVVYRVPSFHLKSFRGEGEKEEDHKLLLKYFEEHPDDFYVVGPQDRSYIRIKEAFQARKDMQKDRIACQQRLYQRAVGQIFLTEAGKYPEGTISDEYDRLKANDTVLLGLLEEEKVREQELKKAVHEVEVWERVFKPIEGCGEALAARIISAVADIRRFEAPAQLKAFLGVHVMEDGRFPRRRQGQVANWHPDGRQALYLLGEQWNRRPQSEWGQKLRQNKQALRQKHPEVHVVEGKKRYTDAHIHKMGLWRTRTRFVEHLFSAWWELEGGAPNV